MKNVKSIFPKVITIINNVETEVSLNIPSYEYNVGRMESRIYFKKKDEVAESFVIIITTNESSVIDVTPTKTGLKRMNLTLDALFVIVQYLMKSLWICPEDASFGGMIAITNNLLPDGHRMVKEDISWMKDLRSLVIDHGIDFELLKFPESKNKLLGIFDPVKVDYVLGGVKYTKKSSLVLKSSDGYSTLLFEKGEELTLEFLEIIVCSTNIMVIVLMVQPMGKITIEIDEHSGILLLELKDSVSK
ncbi:MAG: hypothetical protein PF542_05470 [Nanoarchaeota archaeon]|jgi:hypothetical protein|nr:hypothetical protein [Nanoarchaeota archaeon]